MTDDERYDLEEELADIEAELEQLYEEAKWDRPVVNDRVWHETWVRQQRVAEIKQLLNQK